MGFLWNQQSDAKKTRTLLPYILPPPSSSSKKSARKSTVMQASVMQLVR